jgi:tetratricopeptide (TPR) repeat protein
MRRASFIVIVPALALLLAVWTIPVSAQETAPPAKADAAAAAPAAKDAPKEIPEYNEAVNLFRNRDADGALTALKKACRKHPEISPPYVILARFYASANAAPGMRNALEEGVKSSPNDPEAYLELADMNYQERRVTEARLLYEKATALLAKSDLAARRKNLEIRTLAGMSRTSQAREDWAAAQQYAENWLKIDPQSIEGMTTLAGCLLRQKNVNGALEYLVKAYRLAEDQAKKDNKPVDMLPPEAIVAEFYWRTGDQENAQRWMVVALREKPRDIKVRLLATQWAWETGKLVEAERQANAVLQLDPQSLDGLVLRGLIARFQKNYKAAEEYSQRAVLLKPTLFAATNNLALALAEQNSDEKKLRALDYAESNAKQYQKTNQASEAFSTYGWVLYKLEKYDDAEKALRAAVSGGSFTPDTAYYLARVMEKRGGHTKDVINLLENALKIPGPFAYRDDAKALLNEMKK